MTDEPITVALFALSVALVAVAGVAVVTAAVIADVVSRGRARHSGSARLPRAAGDADGRLHGAVAVDYLAVVAV
ncbi:hypothetical protein [Haloprofundus salinisoli]|uniref:hypothetical protein n=1 Tax=Haloprofundus salinisoli TaxID=2876193 RepID=UPI001CCB1A5A|nr:hypothetical protein [Haloprofundus salinisoli]